MASAKSHVQHRRSRLARHLWGSLAATLLLATVGSLGATPSASATANHIVTITLTPAIGTTACDASTNVVSSESLIYARPGDTIRVTWTGYLENPGALPGDERYCAIGVRSLTGGPLFGWSYDPGGVNLGATSSRGFNFEDATRTFTVGTVDAEFPVYLGDVGDFFNVIFSVTLSPRASTSNPEVSMAQLTLNSGDGNSCSVSTVEGTIGRWVNLPQRDSCTHTSSGELLGWATRSDFPVTLAQRQIDNGWGAYETFDDDGNLTGVFIPAGGATLLSNDNVLHAIWSN